MIRIQKVFTSREAMRLYMLATMTKDEIHSGRWWIRYKKRKHHEGYNFYLIDFQYKA